MLINLLQKNRSYRSYDEAHHVSRATLEELIDCTRYTASSVNMQPLKYFCRQRAGNGIAYPAAHPLGRQAQGASFAAARAPAHGIYYYLPGSFYQ